MNPIFRMNPIYCTINRAEREKQKVVTEKPLGHFVIMI